MVDIPLSDEIKALGISRITVTTDQLTVYNGNASVQSKLYKNSVERTLQGLENKMLDSGHFGDIDRIQKIMILLSDTYVGTAEDSNSSDKSAAEEEGEKSKPRTRKIPISQEPYSRSALFDRYNHLKEVVLKNIPKLWPALEFAISVKCVLNIKGNTLPFAGIILGPASSLKTVVIELFRDCDHVFYTDNFSARAFVSHNSSVKREELEKIDMLPKIKDKLFLTPELAPTFAQREDELMQTLGIMTRILDGHGYESDTGAQGHRGYNGEYMFSWIGGAVDISHRVHKQLALLGPKLYFFRLSRSEETEEYYLNGRGGDFAEKKKAIQVALIDYLSLFEANSQIVRQDNNEFGLSKIPVNLDADDLTADRYIIRLGILLAYLRAVVPTWETKGTQGSEYAYAIANIEDPSRAITQLRNLARGHALSRGRNHIATADVPILINTVFSTASMERVRIFELLIANGGELTTSQIVTGLNTTYPTARRTMTELKATGVVDMYPDISDEGYEHREDGSTVYIGNAEKTITLKKKFNWFLNEEFASLRDKIEENLLKENCTPRDQSTIEDSIQQSQEQNNTSNDERAGYKFLSTEPGRPKKCVESSSEEADSTV